MLRHKAFSYVGWGLVIYLWSDPLGFKSWIAGAPAFQSWFAVEYSSWFISVMNLDLNVRCFDPPMSSGPSRGPILF